MAMAAEWKAAILKSLQKNRSLANARYFQIATIKPDGRPSNRTVVFRGFLDDTDLLTFITDTRSNKIEEIAHNPQAEICWYMPKSREQYRLSGRLSVIRNGDTNTCASSPPPPAASAAELAATRLPADPGTLSAGRLKIWGNMSDPARAQFMWPDPGLPRTLPQSAWDDIALPEADSAPPSTFALIAMEVASVDHLLLPSNRRFKYERAAVVAEKEAGGAADAAGGGTVPGDWVKQEVNP